MFVIRLRQTPPDKLWKRFHQDETYLGVLFSPIIAK